jgi:hypothetical protein
MNRLFVALLSGIVVSAAAAGAPQSALAQEKQHASLKAAAETSKITQGHNIDVGDVPGHIVRVYEVHRTYPSNPAIINGLKLIEVWERGLTELTEGNGNSTATGVYVMDNGDKFFVRAVSVIESASGKLTAKQVGNITGGMGKLAGIRGTVHAVTNFDINSGFNEAQTDIDYTIGK